MPSTGLRLVAAAAVALFLGDLGCAAGPSGSEGGGGGAMPRSLLAPTSPSDGRRAAEPPKAKAGFVNNIDRLTLANEHFRQVLYTGHHLQLVLMALKPGESIGEEVHPDRDQFFRIEAGEGELVIDGVTHRVAADFAIVVPAGARHNVRNVGTEPLKLYTLYGPPEHRRDVVQRTKAEAERQDRHFDGKTTE